MTLDRAIRVCALATAGYWATQTPLPAQEHCRLEAVVPTLAIPHASGAPPLTSDPGSPAWTSAARSGMQRDCTHQRDYPELHTEIRGFWTDTHVYFLFMSPYRALNVFLPAHGAGDRDKLWDRDVVELFLGADATNINRYREFEIAPTGDHVDLAIEYDRQRYDQTWNSGWEAVARIDEKAHRWYAAARIPIASITADTVKPGTQWRINLYRIDGEPPDPQRRFMCWQPTCVLKRDPNHVPENFGTLVFTK